jgi:hypothetical protein
MKARELQAYEALIACKTSCRFGDDESQNAGGVFLRAFSTTSEAALTFVGKGCTFTVNGTGKGQIPCHSATQQKKKQDGAASKVRAGCMLMTYVNWSAIRQSRALMLAIRVSGLCACRYLWMSKWRRNGCPHRMIRLGITTNPATAVPSACGGVCFHDGKSVYLEML